DCRCAVLEEALWELHAQGMRFTNRVYAREYSATTRENVHGGRPLKAPFKFVDSRAGEYGVRMRIDETRQDDLAMGVEFGRPSVWQLIGWSYPRDRAIVVNRNRSVFDDAEIE